MQSNQYMPSTKKVIQKNELPRIGIVLQLARKFRKEPILFKGGKKYRLVTIDPSSIDTDHMPDYLKKRITTLHK